MKHIAAVLLLALGNQEINEANIKKVLAAAGAKADDAAVKTLATYCKGKKVEDIIKEGAGKLGSVVAAAPAAAAPAEKDDKKKGGKDDKKKEDKKKKEEKKVEEEEDDFAGVGDLF